MIVSTIANRLIRGEGVDGLGTTEVRLIYAVTLALDVLLGWWLIQGISWLAIAHAALTIPAAWAAVSWGHGAFQRPHEAVLYQISQEIQKKAKEEGLSMPKATEKVTTEKHALLSRRLFGRWQQTWDSEKKVHYQVAGMSETGVVRQLCFALPDILVNPLHILLSAVLGLLAGPLYRAGWMIWVWSVRDIHDMYAHQKPIKGFLYGGDHVGDLLQGLLWVGTRWLSIALAPSVFWLASAGFFNG